MHQREGGSLAAEVVVVMVTAIPELLAYAARLSFLVIRFSLFLVPHSHSPVVPPLPLSLFRNRIVIYAYFRLAHLISGSKKGLQKEVVVVVVSPGEVRCR